MARELRMVCKNEYLYQICVGENIRKGLLLSPLAPHPDFERQLSYTVSPAKITVPFFSLDLCYKALYSMITVFLLHSIQTL